MRIRQYGGIVVSHRGGGRTERDITALRSEPFGIQPGCRQTTMHQHRLTDVSQSEHPKCFTFYCNLFKNHDIKVNSIIFKTNLIRPNGFFGIVLVTDRFFV